jgi:hypothetical protein
MRRPVPGRTPMETSMTHVDVYDPAQCCATGACGPAVDVSLAQFASWLDSLKAQGVQVSRYGLSQQPGAFAQNPVVRSALEHQGVACLPLVLMDGRIVSQGRYPQAGELAVPTPAQDKPVAVAASCCGPQTGSSRCCG